MVTYKPKHILIAPLDWGLGHTTRCIPIITCIRELGHVPLVAGNEVQEAIIKAHFRDIDFIRLGGYNISYSKWNKWAQSGLLSQLPHIHKAIKAEHEWLMQLAAERSLDGIISDNRYGLYHPVIPSVILTHQLQIQTGFGNAADRIIQKIHYKYLDRFNATWVADVPDAPNLAGKLAHTKLLPRNTKYIGLLSRFHGLAAKPDHTSKGPLVILLSGPEPQRSALSGILWKQVLKHDGLVIFIEGNEHAVTPAHIPPHIAYHKILANDALATVIINSTMVICRSGYSSLMDLVALRKKAILIPTPGQTEQEYLGKELHDAGVFFSVQQDEFVLKHALAGAARFPYITLPINGYDIHRQIIYNWLVSL